MLIIKSKVLAVLVVSASVLTACVYDDEPPRRLAPEPKPYSPDPARSGTGGSGPSAPPTATTSPSSSSPMLVEVDADQTMTATGGEGVGVFIEYGRGGHWHVSWTCDTAQTKQSCEFAVGVQVASGSITNLDASELAGGFAASPTSSRVDAKSTTTTQVHGIRFDTAPGAVITVDAAVGGLKDGAFLFFVQDGKVNGGFAGKLTNPLELQGNKP